MASRRPLAEPLTGHVVSHTHWDRAWYLPFEAYRIRLVTLISKLLDIMERDLSYKFTMDGQTAPLEDYFEIRPEDRPRVERLAREGRLGVGPFYVVPDEFLVTGESLIRNLAIGFRQSKALGDLQMVGYTTDVFGHASQSPQILRGFGIDNALFGRGLTQEERKRAVAWKWIAPDGSDVTMYFMPPGMYATFYMLGFDSFDPAEYPNLPVDADEWSIEKALRHLERNLEAFRPAANTRHMWLGNGVDHQEAQPQTPAIIAELNRRQDKVLLRHSTITELMDAVKAEGGDRPEYRGALRPGLEGTMTSRVYLKQAYSSIATRTEALAEPLLATMDIFGRGRRAFREMEHRSYTFNPGQNWIALPFYPSGEMEYLWKLLLRNAPHDDICGCSVDAVHQDMENRFKRAREISEYFIADAMVLAGSRFAQKRPDSKMPVLTAFNPHPWQERERLTAQVFVAGLESGEGLTVTDAKGAAVAAVIEAKRAERRMWDGNNFVKEPTQGMDVTVAMAPELAACSLTSFDLCVAGAGETRKAAKAPVAREGKSGVTVEDTFQKVTIRRDGTFDVRDKETGRAFRGLGLIEDVEDVGDGYNCIRFEKPGKPVTSKGARGKARIVSHDALSTAVEVALTMRVPAELTRERKARSRRTVALPMRFRFDIPHLGKGGRLTVTVDNKAKNHEMYLAFPTGIAAQSFEYDSKFDYDSYPVGERVARIDSVAVVRDKGRGGAAFGIVGECPTLLVSRKDRGGATLLWSLLRAVEHVNRSIPTRFWPGYEGQCLRTIERRFEWVTGRHSDVRREALRRRRSLIAPATLVAVTPDERLRYRDGEFTTLEVPDGESLIRVEGDDVHLSAWKRSDDGSGWVVRVYSLAAKPQRCSISAAVPVAGAALANLNEETLEELTADSGRWTFEIRPKEIKTLLLRFDAAEIKRRTSKGRPAARGAIAEA